MPLMEAPAYVRRLNALKTIREPLEIFWRDAYDFTFPIRGEGLQGEIVDSASIRSSSVATANEIYDSTAKIAVKLLVSTIMSGMFPAHNLWLGLEVRNNDEKEVVEWLEETAKTIWLNIHASNFDVVAFDAMVDMVVAGLFGLFIKEGSEESGQPYQFEQWPLASLYCADSTGDGVVDTVYREFKLTAEQAVSTYGEDEVSTQIKTAAEKKPSTEFSFLHVIHPFPDHSKFELPIASVHIDLKAKKIVRKDKGFHEMPVVVPRWFVIPGSVYATGPIDDALPDIKSLNELVKITLASLDMSVSGMWGAVDDGVLNPKTIKVGPRKVIPVANKDSFFPLSSGVDFNAGELTITNLQNSIKEILMSNQLPPIDGPAKTATEFHIRLQFVRQMLGPLYGRIQVEFLQVLVKRCFGIGLRAEAFNEVPESLKKEGAVANVTFMSPLAKAQKLETVGAIERFEAQLYGQAGAGTPEALDIYDLDEANREKANMLGVPEKLLKDEDDVTVIRADRAEAQQAQVEQAQEQELTKAAVPGLVKGAV